MLTGAENIARQIGLVQAAIKRPFFGDPKVNAEIIDVIASKLSEAGTRDIRDLVWLDDQDANFSFFYDRRTGHAFPNGNSGFQYIDNKKQRYEFMFYQNKDDDFLIYAVPTAEGFPIWYAIHWTRGSDWLDALHGIVFVVGTAVSLGFPGLGATIGQTILGPQLAASYPALATGVGNAVLQTAFNGGDIQAAAVSALAGGIGGAAGSAVQTATDSRIIGSVTNAVVKSAVVGGDLKMAAGGALLSNGLQSLSQLDVFKGDDMAKLGDSWGSEDSGTDLNPFSDANYSPPVIDPVDFGAVNFDPTGWDTPAYQDIYANMPATGSVVVADPLSPPSGPSGIVASINGADLTKLAMQTLQLVAAFRNAGAPSVMAGNGATQANANGTLTSRNANGTVSTRQMPPGTPYLTNTGALVTNNGDGTYTTIDAQGRATTVRYASGVSGGLSLGSLGNVSPLMLGAGAVALVLLFRK